jgi:hypothetical protein
MPWETFSVFSKNLKDTEKCAESDALSFEFIEGETRGCDRFTTLSHGVLHQ